ncbi:MAG TPA: biotin carboxylase N-terminal domain-containing protein [Bacteroidales bacterium]|nr:biotin carboxylase N-terminal domain-containing protein [Bacteroidales bacterium]
MSKKINKILVANRGEIALRIMQTARHMNITTVAVYAKHEGEPMHRDQADESWSLGAGTLAQTYLNIPLIMDIAKKSGADAIHPGYGFLSENPKLARACKQNGILFIGPTEKALHTMGNKLEAARFVESLNIPLLNIKTGTPSELMNQVTPKDFPLMIKAAAGGGGKGMRIIHHPDKLSEALTATAREAKNYFANPDVYIEKYVAEPKHVEIQILSDEHGNCVHLFERECSIQRRHQKIIEEAPSPSLDETTREKMGAAAAKIAREIGYTGAGTVEFLLDEQQRFFFLEMNTRIQVEHPVSEMITGKDLVQEQILIAQGYPLTFEQKDLNIRGHAIEARLYAEDPDHDFMPSPGYITRFTAPAGAGIRTDTGVRSTDEISSEYDPMIAKIVAWAEDRNQAINRLRMALDKTIITGIRNNRSYLNEILQHAHFADNTFTTRFIERHHRELKKNIDRQKTNQHKPSLLAAYIFIHSLPRDEQSGEPAWKEIGYWRPHMHWDIQLDKQSFGCRFKRINHQLTLTIDKTTHFFKLKDRGKDWVSLESNENRITAYFSEKGHVTEITAEGITHFVGHYGYLTTLQNKKVINAHQEDSISINSPMFGKVLSIEVDEKMTVKKGQTLMILEAMKMENNIQAPQDTTIKHIAVKEGDQVKDGQLLLETL